MAQNQHEGERIAKLIARAGLCSRREAETWIAAGRVSVNGEKIATPALNVTRADRIAVDGKPLPGAERTRLFLYHKPRGLVTTSSDPQGRPTIFGALPKDLPRLISIGRLDLSTEGLLLLTNDGGLARALELPSTAWLRRYRVRAHGTVTQEQLDALGDGVTVDGISYGPIEATLDREQGSFMLTQEDIQIPADTREFAVNMSNMRHWDAPVKRYIDECLAGKDGARGKDFNMRWIASMVADVHRILMRGGVFMYPWDKREPEKAGKLRLMYEANPMSWLVEQAGGASTNGRQRIMDLQPTKLHERVAVVLGSKNEVERLTGYHDPL